MKKRIYEKPLMVVETFVPQEYVATCEHSTSGAGNYLFACNAGMKNGHNYPSGIIYKDTNGNRQFDLGEGPWSLGGDQRLGAFNACNKKHESPTTDEYSYGFFVPCDYNDWTGIVYNVQYDKVFPVMIWQGDGDLHATEDLDRETWEKNHS